MKSTYTCASLKFHGHCTREHGDIDTDTGLLWSHVALVQSQDICSEFGPCEAFLQDM